MPHGGTMQEDVRTWIGEVIIDALRFVVRYDGGDDISTLRESTLEEGSSGWVVECLLMELKRAAALRPRPPKLGQLQQRLWNEHIYNIIKVRCTSFLCAMLMLLAAAQSATVHLQNAMHCSASSWRVSFSGACRLVQPDTGITALTRDFLPETACCWPCCCVVSVLMRMIVLLFNTSVMGRRAQAYADLGPLQREHIKNENILGPLLKAAERVAEHGLGRETPPTELVALFHLLSTLLRRCAAPARGR